jgi:hypothetical protein
LERERERERDNQRVTSEQRSEHTKAKLHIPTEHTSLSIKKQVNGILQASFSIRSYRVSILYIPQDIFKKINNPNYKFNFLKNMAKQKGNVVTHGLRGKVGGLLVFRQVDGETIVSKIPESSKNVTEGQKKHQKRFQQATIYGKSAVSDPQLKELYDAAAKKKKGLTAYNVAVADFLNAPDIENVDLSAYTGAAGDEIKIIASDDFAVKAVQVSISNVDGTLIEKGYASQSLGNLWIYHATQDNNNTDGDKIVITASDIPGNITTEEMSL